MSFEMMLKIVRKRLEMSQEQMARELNVSFSTVNRWENGKSRPSQMAKELFRRFCNDKGIDLNMLEKGDV